MPPDTKTGPYTLNPSFAATPCKKTRIVCPISASMPAALLSTPSTRLEIGSDMKREERETHQ